MKLKKIVVVALATVLCMTSSFTAFAAGLSSEEQAILDKLKAGVEVEGQVVQIPAELLNQVENEFTTNATNVTADQAAVVTEKIDEAIAVVQEEGITSLSDLKASADTILPIVKDAADEVGYTVAFNASKGDFAVLDADGNTVFTSKAVVNQTGFDMTSTALAGGSVVMLLAACLVVANKKKLFAKAIEA